MGLRYMGYLIKTEAEERLRFAPEGAKFCPDCLTQLREAEDDEGHHFYCPNEMCLNDEEIKFNT